MKIYFAGSVRGGRGDVDLYKKIIDFLRNFGEVLTEHVGSAEVDALGERGITVKEIHDRDLGWLFGCDVVVAEITTHSAGVGYEIGRAVEHGKRVLCLFKKEKEHSVSAMLLGSSEVNCFGYADLEEALQIVRDFFGEI